jgi:POT family proton-dependent oligopeptide transporter
MSDPPHQHDGRQPDGEPDSLTDRGTNREPAVVSGLVPYPRAFTTLFFTELWERFSYYGMRAILALFIVAPIAGGGLGLSSVDAARIYGNYTMAVYMLGIPGGFIADRYLGAHRSVLIGGTLIALGHYTLAIASITAFYAGLTLVAIGTGLFKPNISAMVGRTYEENDPRRDAGFSIFYMSVNIGALFAPIITAFLAQSDTFKSWLADHGFDPAQSWHWGFGAAGVGMTIALLVYLRQMRSLARFGEAPAHRTANLRTIALVVACTVAGMALTMQSDSPGYEWLRSIFLVTPLAAIAFFVALGNVDSRRLAAVAVLFIASMLFWAIFEQAGITIALFADQLTRNEIAGIEYPSAWILSFNALFVILLAPLFAWAWVRLGSRQPSSPMKFTLGLFFLGLSFLLMVPAALLTAQGRVSPLWLVGLFFLQTVGELFLSPVGLSLMTRLVPTRLVGLILGVWFLAAAWGNKLAGILGSGYTATDPHALAMLFLQQAALVGVATLILLALVPWVKRLMGGVH